MLTQRMDLFLLSLRYRGTETPEMAPNRRDGQSTKMVKLRKPVEVLYGVHENGY